MQTAAAKDGTDARETDGQMELACPSDGQVQLTQQPHLTELQPHTLCRAARTNVQGGSTQEQKPTLVPPEAARMTRRPHSTWRLLPRGWQSTSRCTTYPGCASDSTGSVGEEKMSTSHWCLPCAEGFRKSSSVSSVTFGRQTRSASDGSTMVSRSSTAMNLASRKTCGGKPVRRQSGLAFVPELRQDAHRRMVVSHAHVETRETPYHCRCLSQKFFFFLWLGTLF